MTTIRQHVEHVLNHLDRHYDPEHEKGSIVTTYDMELYEAIGYLATEMDSLNRRIADLEVLANE